jgi:uncharacterized membrane protein YgaE (UPF0421/DUF939 family)
VRTRLEPPFKWLGPVLVQAAKTALAAGLAWFLAADVIGNSLPVFAPLAAVLTVQVTVWDSVSRGLQRALGVVVGVLLAYALARLLGVHVWSVVLVVFLSWLAGQAVRLGQQGAVQVPVSALLVLVLGATTTGYAADRVEDTFLGAAVGVLVSLVVVARSHLGDAQARVRGLAANIVGVLRGLADGLALPEPDLSVARFSTLLGQARALDEVTKDVALAVQSAETATRWSPRGYRDRPAAEMLVGAMKTLDQVTRSTRGMARVLADAPPGWHLAPDLAGRLRDLLRATAGEVDGWAEGVTGGGPSPNSPTATRPLPANPGSMGAVAGKYRDVLMAARSTGVSPETSATADAVAIYGLRISDDLQAAPDQVPTARKWRSLLGP